MQLNKVRSSNIELLRIIAMVMIVAHHMLVQGVSQVVGCNNLCLLLVDNVLIYGVNIFLLISGYFTIRFSWKKLFSLLWICSFYKIFHLIFRLSVLSDSQTLFAWIGKPLGVLFSTGGWFMDLYILLFLLSPIINKALFYMSNKEYKIGLFIILSINICWGWIKGDAINPNGYTISHFIMMYYLGYGCKKYIEMNFIAPPNHILTVRNISLFLILCILTTSILTLFLCNTNIVNRLYAYNNPLVILGSLLIFILFIRMAPFTNNVVNFIAVSVFPVYLVHHQTGFVDWFMSIVVNAYLSSNRLVFVIVFAFIIILLLVFTIIIDQIRKRLSPFVVESCLKVERLLIQPLINKL